MNYFDPKACVQRGAERLDKVSPDWHFRVKPEDIVSIAYTRRCGGGCILDAVFGSFDIGIHNPALGYYGGGYQKGFACHVDEDTAFVQAWRELITERRAAAKPSLADKILSGMALLAGWVIV